MVDSPGTTISDAGHASKDRLNVDYLLEIISKLSK
jgi:hypothetical protein